MGRGGISPQEALWGVMLMPQSALSPERGAKPVTSFVRNLSALSDWYSVYTSAIAFTVSGSSGGVGGCLCHTSPVSSRVAQDPGWEAVPVSLRPCVAPSSDLSLLACWPLVCQSPQVRGQLNSVCPLGRDCRTQREP